MTPNFSHFSTLLKQVGTSSLTPKRATMVVLMLLGAFGGWGWIYVTENEQYLVQRNFRLLHLWGEDIRQKVQSYEKVFELPVKELTETSEEKARYSLTEISHDKRKLWKRSVLTNQEIDKRPLSPNMGNKENLEWPCSSDSNKPDLSNFKGFKYVYPKRKTVLEKQLRELCATEGLLNIQFDYRKEPERGQKHKELGPLRTLKVLSRQPTPTIELLFADKQIQVTGTINLSSFLNGLQNSAIFDEVLLYESAENPSTTSANHPLLYHNGTREFTVHSFNELIQRESSGSWWDTLTTPQQTLENGSTSSDVNKNDRIRVFVFGHAYEAFTYTVKIPGFQSQEWILVGLIDEEKFHNSALAISSTALLGMMFLLLILVITLPLLHLKMMGPTDPLRASHVLALVLSALLGTGLFTFLALDFAVYKEGKQELRTRLEQSAKDIKESFLQELHSVLYTLDAFDHSTYLQDDFREVTATPDNNQNSETHPVLSEEHIEHPCSEPRVSSRSESNHFCYSEFLYLFWMDQQGFLRINWANKEFSGKPVQGITKNFPLHNREYVQAILNPSAPSWRLPKHPETTGPPYYTFFLQPIISWTTGLNTVVASMLSSLNNSKAGWVAAIEFRLASLMEPLILPPGVGFAVIDEQDHRVLFHSQKGRNLREQFLVETDHSSTLQDLLTAQTAGHTEGSYWGNSTSFYLLPLEHVPWSLVVYRDQEILRSVNLTGLLIAGSLYGAWSLIIYAICWFFLKRPGPHRKAPWLWPKLRYSVYYLVLCLINTIGFGLGFSELYDSFGNPDRQLWLGLFIPPMVLLAQVAAFFILRLASKNRGQLGQTVCHIHRRILTETKPFFYPYGYSLLASSFLLLLGALPAFGCFVSVLQMEMRVFSQYQILETFRSYQTSNKKFVNSSDWKGQPNALILDRTPICPNDLSISSPVNNSVKSYGLYPDFFLKTYWHRCPYTDSRINEKASLFEEIYALLSQPFTPLLKNTSLWGFVAANGSRTKYFGKSKKTKSLNTQWWEGISISNGSVSIELTIGYQNSPSSWFFQDIYSPSHYFTPDNFLNPCISNPCDSLCSMALGHT
ncbi:MAG: hypothetical protein R3B74_16040 [Nitrospirales bacterium]|nr:hypothetical protein [Nitrospirales bacterium]